MMKADRTLSSKNVAISSLCQINSTTLACGHANGSITLWTQMDKGRWESCDVNATTKMIESYVANILGLTMTIQETGQHWTIVATASSEGCRLYTKAEESWDAQLTTSSLNVAPSIACVSLKRFSTSSNGDDTILLMTGSAAPRGNGIQTDCLKWIESRGFWNVVSQGSLLGHQDWISCLD
jgi:hypothetical protein